MKVSAKSRNDFSKFFFQNPNDSISLLLLSCFNFNVFFKNIKKKCTFNIKSLRTLVYQKANLMLKTILLVPKYFKTDKRTSCQSHLSIPIKLSVTVKADSVIILDRQTFFDRFIRNNLFIFFVEQKFYFYDNFQQKAQQNETKRNETPVA